ncbi:MAG TPA: thiamine pyrophosphate-dependent enzyme [Dissulfurispiraceae bacterium]|nr:thiamine pyrophosphate-dependent enzyme [Dissulfurispiraceae bacterium]
MHPVFTQPASLTSEPFHYCPGCGHSIAHRLIAEAIDHLGIREKTIGIAPVGCAVFAHRYLRIDMLEAAHGRPPAVATAMKRLMPDRIVFSYQGDGDLAAIGTGEIIHAANRGEHFTVFFINNATYGMTGGQMAPTTLESQQTSTTPKGRRAQMHGATLRVAELLQSLESVDFLARGSLHSPSAVIQAGHYVRRALSLQMQGASFTFVELLSPCPTAWNKTPIESVEWMESAMLPYFKPGVMRDRWNNASS